MQKIRPLAFGIVVSALTWAATTTFAEPSAIERCRTAATDEARIACLEAAVAAEEAPGRQHADTQGPGTPAQSPGADVGVPGPPPDRRVPTDRSFESVTEAPDPPSPPAGEPPALDTVTVRRDDLGAEQVRARTETGSDIAARLASVRDLKVVAYSELPYQRLQVELENGQVWRQIAGDTQQVRADLQRNQTVDIEESRISGYKMRLNEMRRTIRVERIR